VFAGKRAACACVRQDGMRDFVCKLTTAKKAGNWQVSCVCVCVSSSCVCAGL